MRSHRLWVAGVLGALAAGLGCSSNGASGGDAIVVNAPGSAGSGAGQAANGAADDPNLVDTACTISSQLTMSSAISTVGIVQFTTDLAGLDSAHIDFGLDASYGMRAPVDLTDPTYRTVLLGMKADRQYHYRIVVIAGNQRCSGPDNTLQTGSLPNQLGLLRITKQTPQPDKVSKGFMLMGYLLNGPTFIVDSDGDYVWWFDSGNMTQAHMSYDGKYIWTQNENWTGGVGYVAPGTKTGGNPVIHRVSVNGMDVQTYGSAEFGDPTHDFDVTSDGGYVLPDTNAAGGCTKVVERTADGQRHDVIVSNQVHGGSSCLINAVRYWPANHSITFSDLPNNCIADVTESGDILWILGGPKSTFTNGDAISWTGGQHGHFLIAPDRLLVFNNGNNAFNSQRETDSSIVYEIQLDMATKTATRVWHYDGGLQTYAFGDVQRLPTGNTLVNYGVKGTIHEVDSDGKLVQSLSWALGGAIAYVDWRSSLYGPPDR